MAEVQVETLSARVDGLVHISVNEGWPVDSADVDLDGQVASVSLKQGLGHGSGPAVSGSTGRRRLGLEDTLPKVEQLGHAELDALTSLPVDGGLVGKSVIETSWWCQQHKTWTKRSVLTPAVLVPHVPEVQLSEVITGWVRQERLGLGNDGSDELVLDCTCDAPNPSICNRQQLCNQFNDLPSR